MSEEAVVNYCWYCAVNAWPAEVVEAYYDTLRYFDNHPKFIEHVLYNGVARNIWKEENFNNDNLRMHLSVHWNDSGIEYDIMRKSIEYLSKIPKHIRVPYDETRLWYIDHPSTNDVPIDTPAPKGPMLPIPQYDNFPADIKERYDAPYDFDY
jgi:hypothetical protein